MGLLTRPSDQEEESSSGQTEELSSSRKVRKSDDTDLRATLGEHLEELKTRILRIVIGLTVATIFGWFAFPYVYDFLWGMVRESVTKEVPIDEAFRNITDAFFLKLKLSFYIGLVPALPFALYQVWAFIRPGLKPQERKPLQFVVPISFGLFALGGVICWLILPLTLQWFASFANDFPDIQILQEPGLMVMFIIKMILAFGVGFQMPLVVFFLTRLGLITSKGLMRYWRQATVGVFLGSAILTPSGDPLTMSIMAVPLTALFFASVWAARITDRRKGEVDDFDDLD